MMKMEPAACERLEQEFLWEARFTNTRVTGMSGGRIDEAGVQRFSVVSLTVYFQCKRHVGSVGAGAGATFAAR